MILTVGAVVKDDQGKQYMLDEVLGSGGFGSVLKPTEMMELFMQ